MLALTALRPSSWPTMSLKWLGRVFSESGSDREIALSSRSLSNSFFGFLFQQLICYRVGFLEGPKVNPPYDDGKYHTQYH